MIRPINKKDQSNFVNFCKTNSCPFQDFFVTKGNCRLFLNNTTVAKSVFNDCLKNGDKCYIKEENNEIKAVLLVVGYKEKMERKYIKVLAKSKNDYKDLFQFLQWQQLKNLFIKVKKNNTNFVKYNEKTKFYKPSYVIRKSGFSIIAVREKEILLKGEDRKFTYRKPFNKDRD